MAISNKPKQLSEDQVESISQIAVDEAIDFIESIVAPPRLKAQRYYDGEVDIGEEEGRSKVVATKVRDSVRGAMPSLMRVFLTSDRPVEFVPSSPEKAPMAEAVTSFINSEFQRCGGYKVLRDVALDSCVKKVGIAKAYWDSYEEVEEKTHTNLTLEEVEFLISDPDVDVVDYTLTDDGLGYEDLRLQHTNTSGELVIESVAPEDFFIDESASSTHDAYVCGQRSEMRVTDLVQMGFPYDEVVDLGSVTNDDDTELEGYERTGHGESEASGEDGSMRWVTVTEAYMKMDVEGTGIARMHKIILAGKSNKLLDYEPVDHIPYAAFMISPIPHTFFGESMAGPLINDQDVATVMLRSMCDNVMMTNNPRLEVDDTVVNMDDVLNNEIGATIRSQRVGQAISPITVPFTAGQTLGAMQYFDQQIEQKTGVFSASNGLSPDALQSTTAAGVNATVQASAGQLEIYARNLADGGMTDLFRLILKLVVQNSPDEQIAQVNGQPVPINPKQWETDMAVTVNVGVGTGREDQKGAALMKALDLQMQVVGNYGMQNGIVELENVRNTIADILALNGVRNVNRYFPPQPQGPQQPQEGGMDQNAAYVQAEVQKAQIKEQGSNQRKQMELQEGRADRMLEAMRAVNDDDFRRDEMNQELLVEAAKILGQYGSSVDVERIRAMQAEQRQPVQGVPPQGMPPTRGMPQ